MAKGLPKIALKQPKTGLGASVSGVKPPSGVTNPGLPMIDKRKNVGASNLTRQRWNVAASKKMGNH